MSNDSSDSSGGIRSDWFSVQSFIPLFEMVVEKLFNCVQYRRTLWDLPIKLYDKNDVLHNYGL